MTEYLAPDIFCITRRKPQHREYRVTWPCGSVWEFNRFDLEIPEFDNGDQNGVTNCYRTIREAKDDLEAMGCKVEPIT